MRARLLSIPAVGRALGFILVAAAIVATAIHFRRDEHRTTAPPSRPAASTDPLAAELARCQAIGMAARDDADCEAAWAENRRRFFAYRPAGGPGGARTIDRKPTARLEGP